jgi:lipid-A-disaccharide synthase
MALSGSASHPLNLGLSLGMVAGEASGDVLAAQLLAALHQRWQVSSQGIGGPHMVAQGFNAWWPSDMLAVRGYVEVLRHYRKLVAVRKELLERLSQQRPDVFIGVDAPDFNLTLEGWLKERGVRTVHFVAPAVWAWRPERVEQVQRNVDQLLCIFPFEPELFARHGVDARYVGHPLAGLIPDVPDRAGARRQLAALANAAEGVAGGAAEGVAEGMARFTAAQVEDAHWLALLPGSRRAEVDHLLPRFLQATALMLRQRPAHVRHLHVVLPAVPALHAHIVELVRQSGLKDVVQVVRGQSNAVLAACDVTLIASGTATLEAALFKRPMVIAYHMNWLSWRLTQKKRLQPWVGLPNILAQDMLVPELLQEAATPQALAQATLAWLDNTPAARARTEGLVQRFTELHQLLRRDTAQLACDAIEELLAR